MKDSLGNILTPEQEAYFKDSKVVNSKGDLLVCYHGTDANFDTFDYVHINRDNKLGLGFYFTKGTALQYDYEHKLACYIKLLKPVHEEDPIFSEILIEENRLMNEGKTNNEVLSAIVAKFGYDGVIGSDRGHSCIVAFSPNQIKAITNKYPTSSDNLNENNLNESLQTSRYLYDRPMNGPCFITPEGKFLRVPGDTHSTVLEFDEFKDKYPRRVSMTTFCEDTGYIRVNDGSILSNEIYIMMPTADLNEAQYAALEKYLDYITNNPRGMYISINVLDCDAYNSYPIDATYGDDVDTDYIMKRIRQCAKSHKLREDLIESDRFDMFATDSVYEAKNFLLNHNESWRIFIDEHLPLYLIGRPYECTHTEMVDLANKNGYTTKINDFDRKVVCAIYSPKDEYGWPEISDSDAYEDDYRYGYWWDDFVFYSRYIPFSNFELYKALSINYGKPQTGKLREALSEEFIDDNRWVYATNSVYDVKNMILRGDKAYRILWDKKHNIYLVGDHENVIHDDMLELAIKQGYFGNLKPYERHSYFDDEIEAGRICVAIYTPNNLIDKTYGSRLSEDGYDTLFVYEDGVITTRDSEWKKCPLSKAMGPYKKHLELRYEKDDWGEYVKKEVEMESLRESLLLEKSRQELINKSKSSDDYSVKNQAKGRNRWERRKHSQIATSLRDYNRIDMDAFWKGDILEFGVNVHGETDDYVVTIIFENILKNLQQEVKGNGNKLEFKCVLRALLRSFNGENCYVSCTCPDWKYRQAYWATKNQQNSGVPEVRPSDITNPNDTKGAGCKHVNLVISNADWMMKIASVINNYAKWCRKNMENNYARYIFPQIYGMPYNKAVQLSIFDDLDAEDSGLLPSDIKTIDTVIDKTMQGRGEKGQWDKGNEFRFQKKEPKPENPEDRPDQLKLDLEVPKRKQLREPEIEDEITSEDEKNIRISPKNIRPGDEEEE